MQSNNSAVQGGVTSAAACFAAASAAASSPSLAVAAALACAALPQARRSGASANAAADEGPASWLRRRAWAVVEYTDLERRIDAALDRKQARLQTLWTKLGPALQSTLESSNLCRSAAAASGSCTEEGDTRESESVTLFAQLSISSPTTHQQQCGAMPTIAAFPVAAALSPASSPQGSPGTALFAGSASSAGSAGSASRAKRKRMETPDAKHTNSALTNGNDAQTGSRGANNRVAVDDRKYSDQDSNSDNSTPPSAHHTRGNVKLCQQQPKKERSYAKDVISGPRAHAAGADESSSLAVGAAATATTGADTVSPFRGPFVKRSTAYTRPGVASACASAASVEADTMHSQTGACAGACATTPPLVPTLSGVSVANAGDMGPVSAPQLPSQAQTQAPALELNAGNGSHSVPAANPSRREQALASRLRELAAAFANLEHANTQQQQLTRDTACSQQLQQQQQRQRALPLFWPDSTLARRYGPPLPMPATAAASAPATSSAHYATGAPVPGVCAPQVRVHYLGWGPKWDEWLPTPAPRVAGPGARTAAGARTGPDVSARPAHVAAAESVARAEAVFATQVRAHVLSAALATEHQERRQYLATNDDGVLGRSSADNESDVDRGASSNDALPVSMSDSTTRHHPPYQLRQLGDMQLLAAYIDNNDTRAVATDTAAQSSDSDVAFLSRAHQNTTNSAALSPTLSRMHSFTASISSSLSSSDSDNDSDNEESSDSDHTGSEPYSGYDAIHAFGGSGYGHDSDDSIPLTPVDASTSTDTPQTPPHRRSRRGRGVLRDEATESRLREGARSNYRALALALASPSQTAAITLNLSAATALRSSAAAVQSALGPPLPRFSHGNPLANRVGFGAGAGARGENGDTDSNESDSVSEGDIEGLSQRYRLPPTRDYTALAAAAVVSTAAAARSHAASNPSQSAALTVPVHVPTLGSAADSAASAHTSGRNAMTRQCAVRSYLATEEEEEEQHNQNVSNSHTQTVQTDHSASYGAGDEDVIFTHGQYSSLDMDDFDHTSAATHDENTLPAHHNSQLHPQSQRFPLSQPLSQSQSQAANASLTSDSWRPFPGAPPRHMVCAAAVMVARRMLAESEREKRADRALRKAERRRRRMTAEELDEAVLSLVAARQMAENLSQENEVDRPADESSEGAENYYN